MLRKYLVVSALVAGAGLAHAGGSAAVVCSGDPVGGGAVPLVQVRYLVGADAGTPGLFWLGLFSADQTKGAALTASGWQTYTGGLYPFQARYDAGFPTTITLSIPFPAGVQTTRDYVGYSVYAGDGVYTAAMQQQVADRRAALNAEKPDLVASGRWSAAFDSDDSYIWALIQRDMTDNKKYGPLLTIPYLSCLPPNDGYAR
jgi:hypothetical protein